MPVLFNADGVAEDLAPELADKAVSGGTHTIPLVDPEGSPVGVPGAERESLLQKGYTLPTPPQLQSLLDAGKYGTTGQAIGAGVEGALEGASLGLAGKAEAAVGKALGVDQFSEEAQLKRAEQNPIAHPVGEAIGVIGPALIGDEAGFANVLGKVGNVGERAAKSLTSGAPERLATKIAGWAGRGAAESGFMTGEHVLNEALLGDPEATAEHAWAEVGVSTLIGGAGGAIIGKAVESVGNLGKKLFGKGGELLENFTKLKSNAPEVEAAAERFGVEVQPGQVSASSAVQNLNSQIAKEPTVVGRKVQAQIDDQFEKIQGAIQESLGGSTAMTKAEVNDVLREGIEGAVEETYRPLREGFAALKEKNVQFPIDRDALEVAQRKIAEENRAHLRPGSPEGSFTKRIAEQLPLQETIDDLRMLRTSAGKEAFKPTDSTLWHYGTAVKDAIDELEEKSVTAGLAKALAEGKITQEEVRNFVFLDASTKKGYAELRGNLERLAKSMGKSKIGGVEHFLGILSDKAEAGTLAKSLFTKDNVKFLGFLKDNFPEQARVLGQYQKGVLAEKAFKDGIVQPGMVLREVKKLPPEAQRFLFTPEELSKLEDSQTLLDAMPKDINPSGTAKSMSWNEALNPARHLGKSLAGAYVGGIPGAIGGYALGMVGPEVSTFFKRSIMQGLASGHPEEIARHAVLSRVTELTDRTARATTRAAKAIFAREATERLVMTGEERERTSKRISDLAADPQKMLDRLSKMTEGMSEHAPNVSSAMSSAAGRAVQFLASKVPKEYQPSPFSSVVQPSIQEKQTFRRYADAVLDPIGVMSRIGDGTLMKADLEALQSVYPRLYSSMKDAVAASMTEAVAKKTPVPYKTRLGVSMFLGAPVDRSLEPSAIAATQEVFRRSAARPQTEQMGGVSAPQRGTSALSKLGAQAMTPEQAAAARRAR